MHWTSRICRSQAGLKGLRRGTNLQNLPGSIPMMVGEAEEGEGEGEGEVEEGEEEEEGKEDAGKGRRNHLALRAP